MALMFAADIIGFLEGGVSITAASRDARCVPSMARVLACQVMDGGSRMRLLLLRGQSQQLRLDSCNNDCIAVVFSQPTTHRTLQVKGSAVCEAHIEDGDCDLVARHEAIFGDELAQIGESRGFTAALMAMADELVALEFSVQELYDQSPGPDAGRKLAG